MKKIRDYNDKIPLGFLLKKTIRVMKLALFLSFLIISQLWATETYSQMTKLTLKLEDVKISDALKAIEDQSEFFFLYSPKLVDVERKVNLYVENEAITAILNDIFGESIKSAVFDRQIILSPAEQSRAFLEFQQQKQIVGNVIGKDGTPLPGVNVVVTGTNIGTVTDVNGKYTIEVPQGGKSLTFSFIGMVTQEISIGTLTQINLTMVESAIDLDEVIVVGYGTVKKNAMTGSVALANLEPFENVPVNNILETVKGTVAGLNIGAINTAGAIAGITIRGQNSQTASNNPLIVVDGAIFGGSLADISTNDIENFTVLKDASAAAIYGSRSANGVILIETKKGTGINGKPMFEVKMSYGLSNQLKPLEVYNAEGYIKRLLDIRELNGLEADPNKIEFYLQTIERDNYNATPDHKPTLEDPYSVFSQLGHNINTAISMSNSTDKTRYFISGNLIKQRGVIIFDEFSQITGRVNIDSDITSWFNAGIKSSYSLRDYSGSTVLGGNSYGLSPYASLYNDDGTYRQFPQTTTSGTSPFYEIKTEDVDLRNNLNTVVTGVIKVPWIKGLSYNVTYSNTLTWNDNNYFYDSHTTAGQGKKGVGYRSYVRSYNILLDNLIKFNRTFVEKHNLDLTLLYSKEQSTWENLSGYAEGFDNEDLGTYRLESGVIQTVDTGGGETKGIGQMGRVTYTYNNKYTLTGTIRRDGYSAFSKNKKWGIFSSMGLNWNISRENFMKNISAINNLALRASYGSNGNQAIAAYSTLAKIGTDMVLFYPDQTYTLTQYISTLANDNLGWESTTGLNMGLDFAFIKNRITGSVDAYNTATNNLLFTLPLPVISGKNSITSNIGEIRNRGIEINLSSVNIENNVIKWRSNFAFSLNRNEVITILGDDQDGDGKEDDLISAGYFIGRPLGTIYDYKVIDMWQQEDLDNGIIMTGMRPGDYKLEDVDGDGKITSDKDRQFLGTSKENFRWSLTNTFDYKNFSLMFYLYSVWGGNGYYLSGGNTPYNDAYANYVAKNHPVYDYWLPTNTSAIFPRPDYGLAAFRGVKYFDRSFVKLQKVSITYNLVNLVKPWGIAGMSCSLSADNLFTYAPHWVGLDPETNSGIDMNSIPSIRTYLFSIILNF